jgi:hypothetical protein
MKVKQAYIKRNEYVVFVTLLKAQTHTSVVHTSEYKWTFLWWIRIIHPQYKANVYHAWLHEPTVRAVWEKLLSSEWQTLYWACMNRFDQIMLLKVSCVSHTIDVSEPCCRHPCYIVSNGMINIHYELGILWKKWLGHIWTYHTSFWLEELDETTEKPKPEYKDTGETNKAWDLTKRKHEHLPLDCLVSTTFFLF